MACSAYGSSCRFKMGRMQSGGYRIHKKRLWHLVFNCAIAATWLTDHYWRMHRGFYFPSSPCPFLSISLICGFFPAPVTPNGHFFFPDRKEAVHYAWKDYIKSLSNKNGVSDTSQISKLGAIKNTFKMKQPSPTQYYSTYYVYTRYHLARAHILCHGKQRGLKEAQL